MEINREILKLAVPSILANITVPIVGMVDIAVAGHLEPAMASLASAAALIGGIAIGTMLFDLLYWNFGFLRIGTGGLTAQAYGKGDTEESARILSRGIGIALAKHEVVRPKLWKDHWAELACSTSIRWFCYIVRKRLCQYFANSVSEQACFR